MSDCKAEATIRPRTGRDACIGVNGLLRSLAGLLYESAGSRGPAAPRRGARAWPASGRATLRIQPGLVVAGGSG